MDEQRLEATDGRLRRLEALREVSLELTTERDLQKLLILIADRASQILDAERSTLYLVTQETDQKGARRSMLVSRVAQGVEEIRLALDEKSIAGTVAVRGEILNLEDAYRDPRFNPSMDRRHRFKTRAMLTVPMHNPQGEVIGVTQAVNKRGVDRFDRDDEEMLLVFSSQAAIAVENARYLDLQRRTFESLIHGQAVAIDVRDPITAGHTWRVTAYAVEIGRALGWGEDDLEILRYAGLLHDQGKLGVPDHILLKPDRLSSWEYQMIQSHALKTKLILEAVRALFPRRLRGVPEIAAAHHEKLDGSGYPDGLEEERLSPSARVVAVADIFDALTSHRTYREPEADQVVVEKVKLEAEEGKLDAQVIAALEKVIPRIDEIRREINQRVEQRKAPTIRRALEDSASAGHQDHE
jgi:HD-GYP domain-containing protein (c-di-GMP phosphodiesterase class II)